jgi:uncharacterized protein (DUF2147 family)
MHKLPQDKSAWSTAVERVKHTGATRWTGVIRNVSLRMRALPLTDIVFGRFQRFAPLALHQVAEQKAYLATHALALAPLGAYVVLITWLIASSLATLHMRNVVRAGILIASLGTLGVGSTTLAQAGDDPSGVWLTQAGDARVRISRCGNELCGTVVWLKDKIDPATGRPFTDNKNPDPGLARRPMIGLPLFLGMRPAGPGKWSGHVYNADDGKIYVSNLSVSGPSTLTVEGCVGPLCGSESWTRSR